MIYLAHAFVALFAWWYCTLFHELSHAFFAWMRGANVLRIIPYWHWSIPRLPSNRLEVWAGLPTWLGGKPTVEGAQFRFAGYEWRSGDTPKKVEALAPVLMDTITIALGLLSMLVVPWTFGAIFVLFASIDAAVWFKGYFSDKPTTDGYVFRHLREW